MPSRCRAPRSANIDRLRESKLQPAASSNVSNLVPKNGIPIGTLCDEPHAHRLELGDGPRVVEPERAGLSLEIRRCLGVLLELAVGRRYRARYAVDRRVRVGVGQTEDLAVLPAIELGGDTVARAHEVAVHEAAAQDE